MSTVVDMTVREGANGTLIAEPEDLRMSQPSMSKSELVLNCQWWIGRLLPRDVGGFPARYGLAFHEVMAAKLILPPKKLKIVKVAEKYNREGDTELVDHAALRKHVGVSLRYLLEWLNGANPWKVNFTKRAQARTEQPIAWNVLKKTARAISAPTEDTHEYKGVEAYEFPGTADFVIDKINTKKDAPDMIVIDHKTGESCDLPKHSAQLKSLSLAAAKRMGAKRVAGGIFHTPREGTPYLYIDEYSKEELSEHAEKLKVAWSGIGRGALRPGDWCQFCPAFSVCPVHTTAIGQIEVVRGALTEQKIGHAHELISRFEAWAKQYRETVIRPWVVKNGPAPRPDGKLVTLSKKSVRNLSMASIKRKLGEVDGEKRIAELDAEGLIETQEREELRAVNDK